MNRRSQQGVALVVTLIMLSVITVMTVAFLALTRRERASVTQTASASETRLMADAALERAKSMIIGQILATTNFMEPDLIVSRNFINPLGFNPSLATYDPAVPDLSLLTNVSYFNQSGVPIPAGSDEFRQVIANLFFDPRPPVFIPINRARNLDFRFYVDLNRNGRPDTNGFIFERVAGSEWVTNEVVGDPEFIGVLEQPFFPHSRTNRFVGRYAFLVQPVGKSLDINFIHNHGKTSLPTNSAAYFRNQGYGSWEINLAAFLTELNTNRWNPATYAYAYNTNLTFASRGAGFDDAQVFLNWRYNGGYQNLDSAIQVLGVPNNVFEHDGIDAYANGPLYLRSGLNQWNFVDDDQPNQPWPGASSLSHFFTIHDFWFTNFPNFINRMDTASRMLNSYDRYTYYRMLAQLGTDSAPEAPIATPHRLMAKLLASRPDTFPAEPVGRINLNYNNLNYDRRIPGATAFVNWTPIEFFTNVANILLRAQFNFGITNIPVYPTNYYTPAVHRLLQLTANLYDAATPPFNPNLPTTYPSVFRPRFRTENGVVYISDYYLDNDSQNITQWLNSNPHGIPFVIGAKKGLPNFNEFVMQTTALVTRKLELVRANTNSRPFQTNEMYMLGISNFCGVEFWNSYRHTNDFPIQLTVGNVIDFTLSNEVGTVLWQKNFPMPAVTNLTQWRGFPEKAEDYRTRYSFQVPLSNTVVVLDNSVFRPTAMPPFDPVGTNRFDRGQGFHTPTWILGVSNRLTCVVATGNRILDFVHLANLTNAVNITRELIGTGDGRGEADADYIAWCFETNRPSLTDPPRGIVEQMNISLTPGMVSQAVWNNYGFNSQRASGDEITKTIEGFQAFVFPDVYTNSSSSNLVMQAPFSPTRKLIYSTSYQVDDPLVNDLPDHLMDLTNNFSITFGRITNSLPTANDNLGRLNTRYAPWGGNPLKGPDWFVNQEWVKDPGVRRSDNWDFPTNSYPSIGWIGRVHRGTPWQTVYLKSGAASRQDWRKQFLDEMAHPTNDWRLIDIFSVAVHPNASHGQLSINQTNQAAWAAVLGGVTVLTNIYTDLTNYYDFMTVEPASDQLRRIVEGINRTRATFPGGTWRRLGEVLSVPELTLASPYINLEDVEGVRFGIDDAAYERIPQQILSLLKVGDARFVIYSFGQALKPAENSIVTSGPHIGICTNYQITGEMATRAVLRLEGTAARPRPVLESYNILPLD